MEKPTPALQGLCDNPFSKEVFEADVLRDSE
jgi:hypothetical protein